MENEQTLSIPHGVSVWKIMTPAIAAMAIMHGLNELSWVKASGQVATISVSILSVAMICLSIFSFQAEKESRRFVKVLLCGLVIGVAGMVIGKLLSTPICYTCGFISGFFQGLNHGA